MLSKDSVVTIQLLEPTIYVEPSSEMSNVVRGTVNINLPKTSTVKSITVRFDGKMETKSNSFDAIIDAGSDQKALARQSLVIYPNAEQTDRPLVLSAGLTQFGFEMQIPAKLPETIDCADIKVKYQVIATIEYHSSSFLRSARRAQKEYAKEEVRVARLPYENFLLGETMSEPINSRTHKSAWLNYQINVDKKAVALGSDLPITFRFMPMREAVCINRVNIQMLECRNLYRDTIRTSHSVYNIAPSSETVFPTKSLVGDWEGTVSYRIPGRIPGGKALVHSTQEYSDFAVSHTLLVSITLSVPGTGGPNTPRTQKIVTYQKSIDILDEAVGELDSLKLPTYDSPPPFDNTVCVYGEYDRKFIDPPAYSKIYV